MVLQPHCDWLLFVDADRTRLRFEFERSTQHEQVLCTDGSVEFVPLLWQPELMPLLLLWSSEWPS